MGNVHGERVGNVGVMRMNCDRKNMIDVGDAQELRDAARRWIDDSDARAVVIFGTERVFCTGVDAVPCERRDRARHLMAERTREALSDIQQSYKPFVAAIDGPATASGFCLAMSCDLVFASDRATFEWSYAADDTEHDDGSAMLLPRLVGLRRAMHLALLNPRLSAGQALGLGLVTDILPSADFEDRVLTVARTLAAHRALGKAKHMLGQAWIRADDATMHHEPNVIDFDSHVPDVVRDFFEHLSPYS